MIREMCENMSHRERQEHEAFLLSQEMVGMTPADMALNPLNYITVQREQDIAESDHR
jgi:hypothetical protein